MIDWKGKKVLVLSPHTDDAELGAGGLISRVVKDFGEAFVFPFSYCGDARLLAECRAACNRLGAQILQMGRFQHRHFHQERQRILDKILELGQLVDPDLVLCPSLNDIHQDHVTVAQEAVRAFKKTNIWAYELPWNCLNFNTAGFVQLGIFDVDAKVLACKEYKTQADRPYMQPDAIEAQARMRGTQIGVKYAEAFEIIRQVI